MNYWHYSGDASYYNVTFDALVSQLGPADDFVMPTEAFDEVGAKRIHCSEPYTLTSTQGNDDQAFWALAAMSAAEYGFQAPPSPHASWLTVCDNTFNNYVRRWNISTCGGGLQWQFHSENAGFFYKNSISNGAFFQLSARLGRMTGDPKYLEWANRIWDWTRAIGLMDDLYNVFDGTDDTINCTRVNHKQWTYNVAMYLYGAAVLQNYTNASSLWVDRTAGLLEATATFVTPFPNATDVIFEAMCEKDSACNVDQSSMKAYLVRYLAGTSLLAPFTAGRVGQILRRSAIGASYACTAGAFGNTCGAKWYTNASDGTSGLGQQLSAMEVMYALLVNETAPPDTLSTVHIRAEPLNVTSILSDPARPTDGARALYGSVNGAPGLVLFRAVLWLLLWVSLMMVMI